MNRLTKKTEVRKSMTLCLFFGTPAFWAFVGIRRTYRVRVVHEKFQCFFCAYIRFFRVFCVQQFNSMGVDKHFFLSMCMSCFFSVYLWGAEGQSMGVDGG